MCNQSFQEWGSYAFVVALGCYGGGDGGGMRGLFNYLTVNQKKKRKKKTYLGLETQMHLEPLPTSPSPALSSGIVVCKGINSY